MSLFGRPQKLESQKTPARRRPRASSPLGSTVYITWIRDSGTVNLGLVTPEGTGSFSARVGAQWEEEWSEYTDLPAGDYRAREGLEIRLPAPEDRSSDSDERHDVVLILAEVHVRVTGPIITVVGDVARWRRAG